MQYYYSPPSYAPFVVDARLPLSTKTNRSTYPRWLIRDTLCLISLVTRPLQPRQLLKQPSSWMQRLSNLSQTCILESSVSSLEPSEKTSPAYPSHLLARVKSTFHPHASTWSDNHTIDEIDHRLSCARDCSPSTASAVFFQHPDLTSLTSLVRSLLGQDRRLDWTRAPVCPGLPSATCSPLLFPTSILVQID